jgi:hypothetical protein
MKTIGIIASAALLFVCAPAFAHGNSGGGMGHANADSQKTSMQSTTTGMGKTTTSTTQMTGLSKQIQHLDKEFTRLVLLARFLNTHGDMAAARVVTAKETLVFNKIRALGGPLPPVPPFTRQPTL